jgi:heptosyltransferase-2
MATPAIRLLRNALPGSLIGGLCRPGIDELVGGGDLFDELHVERGGGVFGPKYMAAKVRPRMYDTALLLTNSFSTALVTRIAGIPRRMGYNRDGRGFLLTDKLVAPRRGDGAFAIIPACRYYWDAAESLLHEHQSRYNALCTAPIPLAFPDGVFMEVPITAAQKQAGEAVLQRAGIAVDERFAVLNPGGNNEAKRWPADRFGQVADHLLQAHGMKTLINGSPKEADVIASVIGSARVTKPVALTDCGIGLGSLKHVLSRASILVTNDTGPRHIAAAVGTPNVCLFGPTDHRWTLIPTRPAGGERVVLADPTLPESESANDHPERCAITRIDAATVLASVDDLIRESNRGGGL